MHTKVKFYALLPSLQNEIGHNYAYIQAVSKAVVFNRWRPFVLVPNNCSIKNLPPFWQKELADVSGANEQKTKLQRLSQVLRNFFPLLFFFQKLKKEKRQIPEIKQVVFLEHFGLLDLPLLLSALFVIRPKIHLQLFYRFSVADFGKKMVLFKFLQKLLAGLLGKENLGLFTDSEIISRELEKYFGQKVKTMPVPHTEPVNLHSLKTGGIKEKRPVWWWPGSLIREEKGLKEIRRLAELLKKHESSYRLCLSKKAEAFLAGHARVVFVNSYLSLFEYRQMMAEAKLVLLPYIKEKYFARTSGIFVEAVTAGAMPAVTEGTWMAYELEKFNLKELVVNWQRKDIVAYLNGLCRDEKIGRKFLLMQKSYRQYHSVASYAKALKESIIPI